MRIQLLLIILLKTVYSFGQENLDTISSYNVKIKFDSISNQLLYYENLSNNQSDYFKKFKLIKNKIIESESSYKYIENGRLKKLISIKTNNIIRETKLFDENGNIKIVISCDKYGIKSINKYENNKLLITYVGFPKNRTVINSNLLTLNSNCHNEKKQI